MKHIALRSGRFSVSGNIQGQTEWDSEHLFIAEELD